MRRGLPALVLAVLVVLAAAAGSSRAPVVAAPPGVVQGAHDAFRAVPAGTAVAHPPVYDNWWFSGTPVDQVNKVAGVASATFTHQHPAGSTDVVQLATPAGTASQPADAASAYWRAPYRGRIDGDLVINWFWSSVDPEAQLSMDVIVTVYADTDLGSAPTKIAESDVRVKVAADPVATRSRVPVNGRAEKSLLIQATPRYINVGDDLRVSYGSAAHPSGFSVPRTAESRRPTGPATTSTAFNGERLDVQAVDIGRPGIEPTMGVDRRGNAFYVAATFDGPAGLNHSLVLRSLDGGATWAGHEPGGGGRRDRPA